MRTNLLFARGLMSLVVCLTIASAARADKNEAGFKSIFDGKSLEGWDGDPKRWSVVDGTIQGKTSDEDPLKFNTFLVWRQGPVDDFVLRLSYKIINGNSGVQYRSKEVDKWAVGGYQGDFEAKDKYSGILYEERGRGVLCGRGESVVINPDGTKQTTRFADSDELQKKIKKEDWNELEITATGARLVHKINGHKTAECVDNQEGKRASSGILALQVHVGPPMTVQFKDIRLKRTRLAQGRKKIVMVAGTPSHGIGEHEFNAGVQLLKKCLAQLPSVEVATYLNGWPADPTAFDNADSIMLYMNGGDGHPLVQRNRLAEVDRLMRQGVGMCCVHYAVEIPKEKGGPDMLRWIGGYYESGYSINPLWIAKFDEVPDHPIANGVRPFTLYDEWYYNMRFPQGARIQPILRAVPPDQTRTTSAASEHSGRSEVVAWAVERPDGGRGFGFTGGHVHNNWGNADFRKLILNALLWTAKAQVPTDGVESEVSADDLKQNLDPKVRRR